jgi:transposase
MRAYSMDLRQRVLADCDGGATPAAAAAKYRVSASWVRRLLQRRRATGETAPRPPGRRAPALAAHADRIREAVRETPDATLAELRQRLALAVSLATLWRAVKALGLTVKKKSPARPSRTGRTSPPGGRSGGPGSRPWTRPG